MMRILSGPNKFLKKDLVRLIKMAIAVIGDSHFGTKSFAKHIFESQFKFFEEQLFPYLLKNNIKNIIHLGDLVHNRNTIDLWVLQNLKIRFFKWFDENGINLHVLLGNHDIFYRNTLEYNFFRENVKEFQNIIVYDKPKVIELDNYKIYMVPWIIDEKDFVK